jgi:hypothetical protein
MIRISGASGNVGNEVLKQVAQTDFRWFVSRSLAERFPRGSWLYL